MKKKYTIGIDIGGTNTDAVIIDEKKNMSGSAKVTTTDPVNKGFEQAIKLALSNGSIAPDAIKELFVGTTHATNALLQAQNLFKVGVIRIAGKSTQSIPTCYKWPAKLKGTILADSVIIDGGFQCDGRAIIPLNERQIIDAIKRLQSNGMESLAIVGVYASMDSEQELAVATKAQELLGTDFPISTSSALGGIGFIERENATILNAALKKAINNGFAALQASLVNLGLDIPMYLTQNNGTLLSLADALNFPILTISAGPTNSFVGAAKLVGLDNAIVADIGGTSTDVGIVLNGFARRSINSSEIANIPLNFLMPDVLSIALGGGSYIKKEGDRIAIGPESCARMLTQKAVCFGGDQLTLTDIAVSQDYVKIPGAKKIELNKELAVHVMNSVQQKVAILAKKIAGINKDLPIVLVGGGAVLFRESPLGKLLIIPRHAEVANAYGAALAEVSSTIDTVISLTNRDELLRALVWQATAEALRQGAEESTIRIIDKKIVPFNYVPNNLARVTVTVAGKKK